MTPYDRYISEMEKRKATKPYMTEKQFKEAVGIEDKEEPFQFIARSNNGARQVKPTIENHIREVTEKKTYAPRISRKGWSKEQVAARKAENVRNYRARKRSSQVIL